jgi:peptidase YpeB-like protein
MKIGSSLSSVSLQALLVSMAGVFSPANALTQQELIAKLEAAGYSQIREVKSTAEGIAVKAMKDGKEVSLVLDSSGQIKERH